MFTFDRLPARPLVMGVLNVTPDSFSDGGRFMDLDAACAQGRRLFAEGADILDVGGESTRPGAQSVPVAEQIARVVPVVTRLAAELPDGATISIDTTSAAVAEAALDAGARIINDVSAGHDDAGLFPLAAARKCGVILMHRVRRPRDDSYGTQYAQPLFDGDALELVGAWLAERVQSAVASGVAREAVAIDPGLGFGKSVAQNFELLGGVAALRRVHPTVAIGASRKSFLGAATGVGEPADRLAGSLAAAVIATLRGVRIIRVHDVALTRQAVQVAQSVRGVPAVRNGE